MYIYLFFHMYVNEKDLFMPKNIFSIHTLDNFHVYGPAEVSVSNVKKNNIII